MACREWTCPLILHFLGTWTDLLRNCSQNWCNAQAMGCEGSSCSAMDFTAETDLLTWIRDHNVTPAANYVNWIGRTVRQVKEEIALSDALVKFVQDNAESMRGMQPSQARDALKTFVAGRAKRNAPDTYSSRAHTFRMADPKSAESPRRADLVADCFAFLVARAAVRVDSASPGGEVTTLKLHPASMLTMQTYLPD